VKENHGILKSVRIPIRPHFGGIGLAPKEAECGRLGDEADQAAV
jgi:hypothetical protein